MRSVTFRPTTLSRRNRPSYAMRSICAAVLLAGVMTAIPTAHATTIDLSPTGDGYMYQTGGGGNGTAININVGYSTTYGNERGLLKFSLSSIPAGSTINSATLKCFVFSYPTGVSKEIRVHRVGASWSESSITWNNNYTESYDAQTVSGGGWVTWDLVNLVEDWMDGTVNNYGVLLKWTTEGGSSTAEFKFASRERSSGKPYLQIDYTPPSGDSFEPDNTSGQATEMAHNTCSLQHSISPVDDQDWIYFDLAEQSAVTIETLGPSGDTRMWLYNSALSEIAFDDDGGSDHFSKIVRSGGEALSSGRYYVKVDEYNNNDIIPEYYIDLTVTTSSSSVTIPDVPDYDQRFEPFLFVNDCGPVALLNVLAYWDDHPAGSTYERLVDEGDAGDLDHCEWLYHQIYRTPTTGTFPAYTFSDLEDSVDYVCNWTLYGNMYSFVANAIPEASLTWSACTNEINAGRPFLVEITDHAMTCFGYYESGLTKRLRVNDPERLRTEIDFSDAIHILTIEPRGYDSASPPAAPGPAMANRKPTGVQVQWSASPDAASYRLYRRAPWEDSLDRYTDTAHVFSFICTTSNTQYLDNAASLAADHEYAVVSVNGSDHKSGPSYAIYDASQPIISVTPATWDFGTVAVGAHTDRDFTVENTGGGTLSGSASVSAPFSIVSGGSYSLAAGQTQAVTVRYSPTAAGSHSDSVAFTGAAGAMRPVSGTGEEDSPVISVTPASQDFGSVAVGSSRDLQFRVENTGGGTLGGSASVPSGPFSMAGTASYSLTAGQTHDVTVRYTPPSVASHSDTVTFTGGGGTTRSVSGSGYESGDLIAHYPFDGNVQDASGNGNHGTVHGATLAADRDGSPNSAYSFDGDNDYIDVSTLNLGTAFSLCAWVQFDSPRSPYVDAHAMFSAFPNGGACSEVYIHTDNSDRLKVGGAGAATPGTVNGSSWCHVAVTYDAGTCRLYVNGAEENQTSTASQAGYLNTIGAHQPTAGSIGDREPWNGLIDEVRVYGRVLSASEVHDLWGGGDTPVISVTPASRDFGTVAVGSHADRDFAVENTGGGTLSGSASVSAPFSIVSGGSYSLTAGQTQAVTVRYSPIAAGGHGDTVTFTGGGGVTRPVSGTGEASDLIAHYPFNGNAQDASGNGNHGTVSGATLSADRDGNPNSAYSFDGDNDYIDVSTLNLGTAFSLCAWVQFDSPRSPYVDAHAMFSAFPNGGACSEVYIHTDNSDRLKVGGAGAATPGTVNGSSWCHVAVTYDAGTCRLYVNGAEENQTSTASQAGYLNTIGAHQPTAGSIGDREPWNGLIDEVRVYGRVLSASEVHDLWGGGDTPVISVTPASRDFGTVAVGSSQDLQFRVENAGAGTLSGSASVPSGPFSMVGDASYSLTAGQTRDVTVRYTPPVAGSHSATVTFTGGDGTTRPVLGTGEGVAPIISVTPASHNFGTVTVGVHADRDFTVENTGGGTLTGSASVPAPFSVLSGESYSLTAGQTQTVTVRYGPTSEGYHSDNVAFTGAAGATRQVSGTAEEEPPTISVTPASQDFGTVTVGSSLDLQFRVENTGAGTLSGTASVPSGPFSMVGDASYSLTAGQTRDVTVRYTPPSADNHNATVIFTGGSGTTRPVSGSGHESGDLLAYYPFDGNAQDASGNGNHGTLNGATLAADRDGNPNSAYSFDGDNDYIDVSSLSLGTAFSLCAWVQFDSSRSPYVDAHTIFSAFPNGGAYSEIYIHTDHSDRLRVGGAGADTPGTVDGSSWCHVAATYDAGTCRLYVNGVKDGQGSTASQAGYLNTIGAYQPTAGSLGDREPWNGLIDEVRVYGRALLFSEVYELATGTNFPREIATINMQASNCVAVMIETVAGYEYCLEWRSNLTDSTEWNGVYTNDGDGSVISLVNSNDCFEGFYRVTIRE